MTEQLMNQNQHVIDVLTANKGRFSAREFNILRGIAGRGKFEYRKELEAADRALPYLPSFVQKAAAKLAAIGLEVRAIPANDGTGRKLYALAPAKTDDNPADERITATKKTLAGFGYGVYEVAE